MDIQETRRKKFGQLQSEVGGQSALIGITGLPQAYLSNLRHGKAPFGEKIARKLEKLAGKPYLWLDDVDVKEVDTSELSRQIKSILDSVPEGARDQLIRELSRGKQ